jgi:DNA-binding transcriptional ArsR family regulator
VYPHLQEEQRICMIYDNQVKRQIMKRLKDEGSVSKSELAVWMKDIYRESFVDIDSALNPFIKMNLIKQVSVKGAAGDMIYLIADVLINRTPPLKVIQNPTEAGLPQSLAADYLQECKTFFENYEPEENDTLKVIETILDPQVYEVLKLLRMAIVTRNVLEKLKKKGVDDVEGTLKKLWDAGMLSVLRDEKSNEYYGLKADLLVKKIYPEYLVNQIRRDYMNKTKNPAVLIEHLNILEHNFDTLQREMKEVSKSKKAKAAAVEE